ncbi:ABC transporter ATP-binding protein [Desulfonatronospira sp. MSAO_Bac3]|uniref:ABC transporter ATP-binding protein n=1 Tax=Desulfonatronospira sp. MSAO_Bac3 TaxID=2293857 RepID=UPI000FF1A2D3|nr:ABC transporter ATP-binding protein [Desulfonatronospira sp. MSAO_Bac3]RQD79156.1 MAG: ABC transporter ATP-binding protein [Desulfonatronospira sp. MSAO_Bac3]
MSLYVLRDVQQIFEGRTVLDLPELVLEAGQSYALLGPNGSGKTTLLHILAMLNAPAKGRVFYKGQEINWKANYLTPIRRELVLVDQHPIMFSTTVVKNVEYGLKVRRINSAKRRQTAMESLERVGMQDFAHRPAHQLSGGETQRVAIARAMACSPQVMLFDEPTASVDVENQAVIEKIIESIRKEREITVIFSTHKRLEASRLAEHRVFLFEGRLTGPGGENIVPGYVALKDGKKVCVVREKLELQVESNIDGPCRIQVHPEKIGIYNKDQVIDSEQVVPGRVLQMTDEGGQIRVLLDIGFPIRSLVSREDIARSGILVGDEVYVGVEAGAVDVVSR